MKNKYSHADAQSLRGMASCNVYWLIFLLFLASCTTKTLKAPPNIQFIYKDDLNDCVRVLKGHPQTLTPNIDRLARQSTLFTHAYTAAPVCNPSRTALLTGIHPFTSGIYENKQSMRASAVLKDAYTLPQYFRNHGYTTMGSGKIFHYSYDTLSWDQYWPSIDKIRPDDPEPTNPPLHGMPVYGRFFDWGPIDVSHAEMGDWQVAEWVSEQLGKEYDKPFFLACGFYKPHLPWYLPQKYFDRFPLDEIVLPSVKEDDLDDVPAIGRALAKEWVPNRDIPGDSVEGDHRMVLRYEQWKQGVQAYLAAISFADECLGKVLNALENSSYRDNTIVVLWSDHGYHLGEKLHWRKSTLWEEATRSLLMFQVPGVTQADIVVPSPVSLVDIYPTLVDLSELPPNPDLQGQSLKPLLKNPALDWEQPVITTFRPGNYSIRSRHWRYTRYADGSEELYDHKIDSLEWKNLATDPQHISIKQELAEWLPKEYTPPTGK